MAIGTIIGSVFGAVGSVVSSFFGFKKDQAQSLQTAMQVLSEANSSNAAREQAIATIIAAESSSGYWLSAVWRPLTMVIFLGLIMAFFFGYMPSHLAEPMPAVMQQIFDLLKIGIMGYVPARTIEKVISNVNLTKVLQTFIDKKLG